MNDFIIWISIGMFLLLPYYLRIYILDFRKTRLHIYFWICIHSIIAIVYYTVLNEKFSLAMVMLIAYAVYYFFSYIFYVRGEKNLIESSSIECIVKSNFFNIFKKIIMTIGCIMLIIDGILILGNVQELELFDKVYLFGTIVISYMQCYIYLREYEKVYYD